jgi:hypothetical protein
VAIPGRTTRDLVEGIIDIDSDLVSLDPFISAANELVTNICGIAGYTIDLFQQIETWLTAHFYCVLDPRSSQEQAGSVQQQLQGKIDLGLKNSLYGQMAMRLDYKGYLAVWDNGLVKYAKPPIGLIPAGGIGVFWAGSLPKDPWYGTKDENV